MSVQPTPYLRQSCRWQVCAGRRQQAAKVSKINPAHTISLRQTEWQKTGETITAAVYEYLVDNDGEWGELWFDFENGTAEIVKLADWDTVKTNIFAKAAIRFIQELPKEEIASKITILANATL